MGNEVSIFKDTEIGSGKLLLLGIRADSKKQIQSAIDIAKSDLKKNHLQTDHDQEYVLMIEKITKYLTKPYDIGEGILRKKTPIDYATQLNCKEALKFLNETLLSLEKNDKMKISGILKHNVIDSQTVGKIDNDRVALAKERLKAFQNEKKTKTSTK